MLLLKFITPGCANCGWIIQKTLPWVMLGESFNGPVISCHTAGSETNSPAAQYHGLRNRLYWGQEKLMKTWSSKKMGGTPPPLPCHLLTIPGCFAGTVYVPVLSHPPFSFMMVQVLMQLCYWGINRDLDAMFEGQLFPDVVLETSYPVPGHFGACLAAPFFKTEVIVLWETELWSSPSCRKKTAPQLS